MVSMARAPSTGLGMLSVWYINHYGVEVVASVTGASTVKVRVREPEKFGNSFYSKFMIQWSKGTHSVRW